MTVTQNETSNEPLPVTNNVRKRKLNDEPTIKKYLEKENNASNYPGGLSEVDFLISFSEKIKKYERLSNYNSEFIAWTDSVYKQIDEGLHKENFKNLNVLWKNFIKSAKIKMGELNEQH